jgi:hypothetical protein
MEGAPMTTHSTTMTSLSLPGFTHEERQALRALRERYHHDDDLFSARELARLRFPRWLYVTGRVVP